MTGRCRRWTEAENEYIRKHYGKKSREEIALVLGRTVPALTNQAGKLGLRPKKEPRWTTKDEQFLRKNWHSMTKQAIAKRLGRTEKAIEIKQKRLKLGPQAHPGMFTMRDVTGLIKVDHRKIKKYIKDGHINVTKAPVKCGSGNIILIHSTELRKFIRKHPEAWDARKVNIAEVKRQIRLRERAYEHIEAEKEDGGNAKEQRIPEHLRPAFALFVADIAINISDRIVAARQENKLTLEWFKQKVKQDMEKERWRLRWTPEDDRRLREMFRSGRYTYQEMAERLGRTASAVGHRLARIDVWTEEAI